MTNQKYFGKAASISRMPSALDRRRAWRGIPFGCALVAAWGGSYEQAQAAYVQNVYFQNAALGYEGELTFVDDVPATGHSYAARLQAGVATPQTLVSSTAPNTAFAAASFSLRARGGCTEQEISGIGPTCNRSGQGSLGYNGEFVYYDDRAADFYTLDAWFDWSFSVKSDAADNTLVPVDFGYDLFNKFNMSVTANGQRWWEPYGNVYSTATLAIGSGTGLAGACGIFTEELWCDSNIGSAAVAVGQDAWRYSITSTLDQPLRLWLEANTSYHLFLAATLDTSVVPFHLNDEIRLDGTVASAVNLAIDPTWERANDFHLDFGALDAVGGGTPVSLVAEQGALPSAVPIPASIWLLGTGLLGFAGFMRRRG